MNGLFIVGGIILGAIILFASLMAFISKNYIRIPPNMAAVIYGRKRMVKDATGNSVEKGYRVVAGGGVFKIPILEEVEFMNLSNRMLPVRVENAPNKDGVMTTVEGVANVKFSSEINLLRVAIERFLGRDDDEINKIILQNLEGHLRAVVGKMTMEALIGDKSELNKAVLEEANDDFNKMGINIDFLNIQDIRDSVDYIKNLGRSRASQIKKDAEIGTAISERDSLQKTSVAKREGIEAANANEMQIYESNKQRDVKKAEMVALVNTQNEIAAQAGPLAQAKALKSVVEAQAETEAAQEIAQTKVETARAVKEEKRFLAEKIVPAEAEKKSRIVNAEGSQQSKILEADGEKQAAIKKAEGEAERIRLTKVAEADGDAAKIIKMGEAEGKAIYAKLSGEASGIKEKAEAYAKLDQTGKFLEILNALQTLAPNMIKEFAGVMAASTAHLSNIKEIKVIDFGGQGNGGSSVGKFGSIPIEILSKFAEAAKGTGFDMSKLFNFLGVKTNDLFPAVEETTKKEDKK
ncbi:MAG: SPFH domain-containing protein [Candidatus Nanoarchaeia archaeon]|nr:SPFH domain-containing protein [Candidatus Nanoarchaeia archaeon]